METRMVSRGCAKLTLKLLLPRQRDVDMQNDWVNLAMLMSIGVESSE